jgi:hypothetical protein
VVKGIAGAILGSTTLWGLVWIAAHVPAEKLWRLWLSYCALGSLAAPFLYASQRRGKVTGDWRLFFVVFAVFCMAACPLLFYGAAVVGIIRGGELPALYLTAAVGIPICFVLAYWAMKALGWLPRRAQ